LPEPNNPKRVAPAAVAIPAVTGADVKSALERNGWSVRGEDLAYWAMRKGGSTPLMVPKQTWPLADRWIRDILKDAGIIDADFVKLIAPPPSTT